jgi:iron complex outermembrane recepter protein
LFGNNKFDALSPRVTLSWHPSRDSTYYATLSEGFRSGVSPIPAIRSVDPTFPAIQPDTLYNYEVGTKGTTLDGRLSYDAALYYIDWRKLQQPITVRVGTTDVGAVIICETAEGLGAEFALTVRPTDRLSVSGNFSWNDLAFVDNVVSGSGVTIFPKGGRLNLSPKYIAGASVSYDFPIKEGYEGQLTGSVNYVSESNLRDLSGTTVRIAPGDSLLTGRTSLSVKAPGNWFASLYVDNATNEEASPLNNILGVTERDSRIRPRTIGLQLVYRY